jgi:hypothetical protein
MMDFQRVCEEGGLSKHNDYSTIILAFAGIQHNLNLCAGAAVAALVYAVIVCTTYFGRLKK